MKANPQAITGVLNPTKSEQHFQLRRYLPSSELSGLVEQYWLLDWDLEQGKIHTQKNLPDPCFHFVYDGKKVEMYGPVSKLFHYDLVGQSKIIGIKFNLAIMQSILPNPVADYVDKRLALTELFDLDEQALIALLEGADSDQGIVNVLQQHFASFETKPSEKQLFVQQLVTTIKSETELFSVEQLSSRFGQSVRSIQRLCREYLGVSPKWLIRRYRLHQVLKQLDEGTLNVLDIVERLGYVDQAHLIKDLKQVIGKTPSKYLQQGS